MALSTINLNELFERETTVVVESYTVVVVVVVVVVELCNTVVVELL